MPVQNPMIWLLMSVPYRLLMRFLGMSFKLPDPFDKRRDEKAIARRMAEIRRQVNDLLEEGWEVYMVLLGILLLVLKDVSFAVSFGESE